MIDAQDLDPVFDAAGFVQHRAYEELAPFERVDTLTGNLLLVFDEVTLPGDAGYDIRIQRVYNSKPFGPMLSGQEWSFGIEGVPMRVFRPSIPSGSDPTLETSWPEFWTVDGATHLAIPISSPSSTSTRFRTKEFWEYRSSDRVLKLPNGLICTYDTDGYLSQISHVLGTLAAIAWTPAAPKRLATITQSVGGDTRLVTFSFTATTTTMTYGSRNWIYTFNGTHLTTAQPPTGPSWQYTYVPPGLGLESVATVTTPNGGRLTYAWANAPFKKYNGTVDHYSWALTGRSTSMNVPAGSWTYSYAYEDVTQNLVTTENGPDTRKRYEYKYLSTGEPVLNSYDIFNADNGQKVQGETFVYQLADIVDWRDDDQVLKTRHVIRRDLQDYTTEWQYFGAPFSNLGQPATINESGRFSRQTTRNLYPTLRDPFPSCCINTRAYRPFLVDNEAIGTQFTRTATFDSSGFKESEVVYGIRHTFARDSLGNVRRETNALQRSTEYTYRWGVVEDTSTPEYVIDRTINDDSTVASERRNGHTTSYQYDGLFRRTMVTPAEGLPTTTEFIGGITVTVRRGTTRIDHTLDGFGRVVRSRDGADIERRYAYDVYGRKSFESLPAPYFQGSFPGTTWEYDQLGRVRRETYADLTRRTYTYGNGGALTITDEQDRNTVQQWDATGTPDDKRLASVTDAANSPFFYSYNALDRLLQVQQPGGTTRRWVYQFNSELVDSETHPESGTTVYQYDAEGRLSRRTNSAGQVFTYTYDDNGRLKIVDAPGTNDDQRFEYDDADNRTLAANAFVSSTFTYDGANRMTKREDDFTDLEGIVTTKYTYTGLDKVDTIIYPSSMVIKYTYDTQGRLARVSRGSVDLLTISTRHPSGAPATSTFGDHFVEQRTYTDRHRLNTLGLPGLNLDYDYYRAGSVQKITETRSTLTTREFDYDNLDRLTWFRKGAVNLPYEYDPLGNRTRVGSDTYSYNASTLRMNGLLYNTVGQVTGDAQGAYTYTTLGMMETATVAGATTTYRYDADNLRAITIPPSGYAEYVVRGNGQSILTEALGINQAFSWRYEYVYAEGRLIARLRPDPIARVALQPDSYARDVNEGDTTTLKLQVTTGDNQPTREPIALSWRIEPYEATAGDYQQTTSGVIPIPVGTVTPLVVDLPISTTEDTQVEANERFGVFITVPPGVILDGFPASTITIVNDDEPSPIHIAFLQPQYTVNEGQGALTVGVRVTTEDGQPTGRAFTVNFQTNPGSAIAAADYLHVSGSHPFPANFTSGDITTIPLTIVNDGQFEPTETFTMSFTADAGIIVDSGSTTVQIVDDDVPAGPPTIVGFTTAAQTVSEAAGSAVVGIQVNTQGPPTTPTAVVFDVATQNGSALAGADYTSLAVPRFTIPAGTANGTVLAAPIAITNDTTPEAAEQFTIAISSLSGGQPGTVNQTITIADDDTITVAFSTEALQVQEASGGVPVTLTVTTATGQPTSRQVTVNYGTVQNTATDGLDYTGAAGTMVIPAGTASGTPYSGVLPLFGDAMDEPNELFGVIISSPDNSATVGGPMVVTIVDDDAPGTNIEFDFLTPTQSISEGAGNAPISVRVITANGAPTSATVPLNFWTTAGSATPNVDYVHGGTGAPIGAGTACGTILSLSLPIINDGIDESPETFYVNIGSTPPGVSAVPTQTITILDDDPGPLGFAASPPGATTSKVGSSPTESKSKRTLGEWTIEAPAAPVKRPLTWTKGATTESDANHTPRQKGDR